jgi:hypothetical protein
MKHFALQTAERGFMNGERKNFHQGLIIFLVEIVFKTAKGQKLRSCMRGGVRGVDRGEGESSSAGKKQWSHPGHLIIHQC